MKRLFLFLSVICAVLLVQVSPVFAADNLPSCRGTDNFFDNSGTNRELCTLSDGRRVFQCVEGTVPVTSYGPDSDVPFLKCVSTSNVLSGGSCLGQCQGDRAERTYPVGTVCAGAKDSSCYTCVMNGDGKTGWSVNPAGCNSTTSNPSTQPTPIPNSVCNVNGSFCRYVGYETSAVTLKVGETKTIKVSGFITSSSSDGPVGAVKFMSSNVNSVTVGPNKKASYSKNICCEFVYGRHNDTVTIYGVAPGKSIITTQYYKQNATAPGCSNKCLTVTVVGAGEETPTPSPTPSSSPLTCDLEVRWTSTGDLSNWKYGDMVTFYADAVPNDRVPTGASVRYEGEVNVYRGNTSLKRIVLVPQTAGASRFNAIKIDETGSRYYFRFRYCVKTAAGVETCSDWGNPQLPGGGGTPVPTVSPTSTPVTCATPPVCPAGSSLVGGDPKNGGCPVYQCVPDATTTPTTHTVKFVNKVVGTRSSMVIDAIKEGSSYIQDNNSRLTFSGSWSVGTDSGPLGGSYKKTVTNGSSVSITTTQNTIYYRTYRQIGRSDVDVYVDGVFKTTLTGFSSGSGWVNLLITL